VEGGGGAEVENKLLRSMFEPKGESVTEIWGKLHNEELIIYAFYLILAVYLTTCSVTLYRVFRYYMPYFTGWFLDIKGRKKFMRTCIPRAFLKNYLLTYL
jgi:hypothetical protein